MPPLKGTVPAKSRRRSVDEPDCVDVAKAKYRRVHYHELCIYCKKRYGHCPSCRGLKVKNRRKHLEKFPTPLIGVQPTLPKISDCSGSTESTSILGGTSGKPKTGSAGFADVTYLSIQPTSIMTMSVASCAAFCARLTTGIK